MQFEQYVTTLICAAGAFFAFVASRKAHRAEEQARLAKCAAIDANRHAYSACADTESMRRELATAIAALPKPRRKRTPKPADADAATK